MISFFAFILGFSLVSIERSLSGSVYLCWCCCHARREDPLALSEASEYQPESVSKALSVMQDKSSGLYHHIDTNSIR